MVILEPNSWKVAKSLEYKFEKILDVKFIKSYHVSPKIKDK